MNKLQMILEAYRNGERDLPGYEELMEIAQADLQAEKANSSALMALADEYARDSATAFVEQLYGTSKSYTAECKKYADEARNKLAAALVSQQLIRGVVYYD